MAKGRKVQGGRILSQGTVPLYLFPPASSQDPLRLSFRTKVSSSLGDRTRLLHERYDGCVVPWCLYLRSIVCTDERGTFGHLEIAPKDEPDLWRSTILG